MPSSQSRPHFPFSQRPNFPSCFVDIATVNSERVVIILICISWWAGPVFVPNRDPGLKRGAFGIWPLEIRNPRPSSLSGMRSKEQVPPSARSDNRWKGGLPQPPGFSAFPRGKGLPLWIFSVQTEPWETFPPPPAQGVKCSTCELLRGKPIISWGQ